MQGLCRLLGARTGVALDPDAVALLAEQRDIDFLYIDGWLFSRRQRCGIGQMLCVDLPEHG